MMDCELPDECCLGLTMI